MSEGCVTDEGDVYTTKGFRRGASMTLWMQNGYFTRLRKTAPGKCPLQKTLLGHPLWRACRSMRHPRGDHLRASAQRSVERKGSRKTPPDSGGNPKHLRITRP